MRPKELVIILAVAAGITSNAEINNVPMTRIVTKMVTDNITINITSMNATRSPDTTATCGSNVAYSNDRYASNTTANTATVTEVMAMMSTHDTPRTLPKRTASMLLRA